MSYLRHAPGARQTPQSQPISGSGQVPNSAGGHAWKIDPLARLARFLVLGSESGSYYASERELTLENVAALREADPYRAIDLIVEISDSGRAPKNDPALFALSFYAGYGHPRPNAEQLKVRAYALDRLPRVARIGTHLFHFVAFVEKQRGWGRGLRRAIASWYLDRDPGKAAYDMIKYRQRDGWSHRDLLRLSHPVAERNDQRMLFDYVAHREAGKKLTDEVARLDDDGDRSVEKLLYGFEQAQAAKTPKETAKLIADYNLPREAVNTDHLTSPEVWEALLYAGKGMPLGALIRNLPTLTRVGLIGPMTPHVGEITKRITDAEALKAARIHPLQVLTAHITYQSGHGIRGSSTWAPHSGIVDALDAAFYAAFGAVEPTGKRILLALDVSSSMNGGVVNGVPGLTPRIASAAMALVTANVEPNHYFMAFTNWLVPVEISPRERLDAVVRKLSAMPFGGTDCALPMLWAAGAKFWGNPGWYGERYGQQVEVLEGDKSVPVDAFVVYTDSETWAGSIHPAQALQHYREKTGVDARSVVVGMVSNGFSIASPDDLGMLDVVGFDAAAPTVISNFVSGKI